MHVSGKGSVHQRAFLPTLRNFPVLQLTCAWEEREKSAVPCLRGIATFTREGRRGTFACWHAGFLLELQGMPVSEETV